MSALIARIGNKWRSATYRVDRSHCRSAPHGRERKRERGRERESEVEAWSEAGAARFGFGFGFLFGRRREEVKVEVICSLVGFRACGQILCSALALFAQCP